MSRTSREDFQHVEKFYANFFTKIFRKTVARQSCDGRATFMQVSRTCRREILANLQCEIFATLVRMSRDDCLFKNVYSMRLQRESCVYIVYLCREIVANYSRTSLQLLHSSEIGA